MPSREQMRLVGQTCLEYDRDSDDGVRSCHSCRNWKGEQDMCALDIFAEQLVNLDQT